jgi:hypothetical protein
MDDANSFIDRLKSQSYKKGYKISEKEEFRIVYDTIEKFGLNKFNFMFLLRSLTILKENNKDAIASGYNPRTNTITYINEDALIHELFHMASYKAGNKDSGIALLEGDFRSNVGLNEGITDYFAGLAKSDRSCNYPFEKIVAETLDLLFGKDIFKGYFNNSCDEFINSFPEEIRIDIIDLMSNLDEYHDLTQSIYSDDYFPEDIISLEEITESILKSLVTIGETIGRDKNEIVEFFNSKVNDPKVQTIRDLIKLDNAVESLNTRNL